LRVWCACLLFLVAMPSPGAAQWVPAGPLTTAGGRLTLGAEAAASIAPDDEAYFNYSDYSYNLLRQVRVDGSGVFRLTGRISLLGDIRVEGPIGEGQWAVHPYALFVRLRPVAQRAVDIQAGLIPPVFGSFSRRGYGADNPLIGFPLGYQYLTSLRADALPASADDLLRMRGRGWRVAYPVGSSYADHGVPLVDGLHNQIGVEVHAGNEPLEASAALTTGSLSVPGSVERQGGAQVSGRVAWRPTTGLVFGVSGARAAFVSRAVTDALGAAASSSANDQRALGFDAEYSRGYFLVRSEGIVSSWRVPSLRAPFINGPLRAVAIDIEGRYRIKPGLYAALRLDRLDFNEITGSAGTLPWDAPVRRVEVGGGYSLQRNVLVKLAYQYNRRDTTVERTSGLVSAQLLFWF
jgi:hypothetical protein